MMKKMNKFAWIKFKLFNTQILFYFIALFISFILYLRNTNENIIPSVTWINMYLVTD